MPRPITERHNARMRALVGVVCVVLAVAVSGAMPTRAGAATKTTLACKDFVAAPSAPPASYSVVLRRVALPTGKAFQAVDARDPRSSRKYFAKQGLLVKPGAPFQLIVPAAWKTRLTLEWGNPGTATDHLWVSGCASTKRGARWLAYVGGFWVSKPACIPVVVKAAGKQRTVHIGAGKACPGQSPPPAA
jgi:hypothetical protein